MRKLILLCTKVGAMALLISASPARAQSVLWVANSGLDTNPCSQTSPCATFQGAINKGSVSQINCLTSGSYGPVIITASITIDCGTGNTGNVFVSSSSATAIKINTSSAATIVLRHLSLNGGGSAPLGINTASFPSGTLIVEDCMVHGFRSGKGISFIPTAGRGLLQVSNSQIFDNSIGMFVAPKLGQIASVTLNRVELMANSDTGLALTISAASGVVAGTMRDSVVGGNLIGVYADAAQVFFTVEGSSIVDNLNYGIVSESGGAIINVGGSTIGGNGTGVVASGGSLISFGNNQMSANGANGSFTSTTPLR